jgi:hypothetical protein
MEGDLIKMGVIINGEFSFQKYCEVYNRIDCQGLHKLIYKFFYLLVEYFKVDYSHCVSLPHLALEVYRSKFLKSNKLIRLLSNRHYNFIKQSYKGSIVSVFKPFGKNLYFYDINSLFSAMMLKSLPVSTPKSYDVSKGLEGFFGFTEAEVTCPTDLYIPVLGIKANINGSEKLIYPTGAFKSIFFSEELKYAVKLGYRVKLIKAISFNKSDNLFSEYVNFFYNKKSSSTGASKSLAKLFLNSLYGRFALHKDFEQHFITSNEFIKDQILNLFTNIKPEVLNEKTVLFNFHIAPNINLKDSYVVEYLNKLFNMSQDAHISNIALASAITSYARIEHHKYLQMFKDEVHYADTDSLYLPQPLESKYIGEGIGQFKNVLADAYYSKDKRHHEG